MRVCVLVCVLVGTGVCAARGAAQSGRSARIARGVSESRGIGRRVAGEEEASVY
jgi:hypothetical protein